MQQGGELSTALMTGLVLLARLFSSSGAGSTVRNVTTMRSEGGGAEVKGAPMGRFQRKTRARSRWQILATILVGIVCAPAMVVLSPSTATAATSGLTTTQASSANPVGDLLGYVETTLLTELSDLGCPLNISKAFCP